MYFDCVWIVSHYNDFSCINNILDYHVGSMALANILVLIRRQSNSIEFYLIKWVMRRYFLLSYLWHTFYPLLIWTNYSPFAFIDCLAIICTTERTRLNPKYYLIAPDIWHVLIPLIYFHIVEWHHVNCILYQFGMQQPILRDAVNLDACYIIQLRGKQQKYWKEEHMDFIQSWNGWMNMLSRASPLRNLLPHTLKYMCLYKTITRRWIHPTSDP